MSPGPTFHSCIVPDRDRKPGTGSRPRSQPRPEALPLGAARPRPARRAAHPRPARPPPEPGTMTAPLASCRPMNTNSAERAPGQRQADGTAHADHRVPVSSSPSAPPAFRRFRRMKRPGAHRPAAPSCRSVPPVTGTFDRLKQAVHVRLHAGRPGSRRDHARAAPHAESARFGRAASSVGGGPGRTDYCRARTAASTAATNGRNRSSRFRSASRRCASNPRVARGAGTRISVPWFTVSL